MAAHVIAVDVANQQPLPGRARSVCARRHRWLDSNVCTKVIPSSLQTQLAFLTLFSVWPEPSVAQGITEGIVTGLRDYLSYGVLGVGAVVAVLASIVLTLTTRKAVTGFLLFGLALVTIGAGLELYKGWQAGAEAQRRFMYTLNLPDEFWNDFLTARKQALFGTAEPTDQEVGGFLKQGETRVLYIDVPSGACRYYFVATKPPAKTRILIPADINHQPLRDKEYYKTGKFCVPPDEQANRAQLSVELEAGDGQFSAIAYVAPPDPAWNDAAQQPEITKVVCTGEYESNCAGPHDVFMQCGAPGDTEIAQRVCSGLGRTTSRALRTNTKGGNRCGYSLVQVTCT